MAGCDLEIYLSPRQLCDAELICNGGFSPLTGFMTEEEYKSVVEKNRLPNGLLFGLPVVYDTDRDDLKPGEALFFAPGLASVASDSRHSLWCRTAIAGAFMLSGETNDLRLSTLSAPRI